MYSFSYEQKHLSVRIHPAWDMTLEEAREIDPAGIFMQMYYYGHNSYMYYDYAWYYFKRVFAAGGEIKLQKDSRLETMIDVFKKEFGYEFILVDKIYLPFSYR